MCPAAEHGAGAEDFGEAGRGRSRRGGSREKEKEPEDLGSDDEPIDLSTDTPSDNPGAGTDGAPTRDLTKTPAARKLLRELDLPAGTSRDAADMIAAELRSPAMAPREGSRPPATPRPAAVLKPRHGTASRGVTNGSGGNPSGGDMILRSGQHRTVSRISCKSRPEVNAEATQQLRAELLKNPGMPVRPGLNLQPRSGTSTPESAPDLFPDSDDSSGDEMEAREQAASECLRRIRSYDEQAFDTARGMRTDPKQRIQFLAQHYTPAHQSKRDRMPWPQVAARASYGFPTDGPIFEEAFPFHKWAKSSTPTHTLTDTTLTGRAAQLARAEGFECMDDLPALTANAGCTPHRGNSPCIEADMQAEAPGASRLLFF